MRPSPKKPSAADGVAKNSAAPPVCSAPGVLSSCGSKASSVVCLPSAFGLLLMPVPSVQKENASSSIPSSGKSISARIPCKKSSQRTESRRAYQQRHNQRRRDDAKKY